MKTVYFFSQFDDQPATKDRPITIHNADTDSVDTILDIAFTLQGNNFNGNKPHKDACSMSIGDVVEFERQHYFLDGMGRGWRPLSQQQFQIWLESSVRDRSWLGTEVFWKDED